MDSKENELTTVFRSFTNIISNNPVVVKEMRGRMRGGRAFILLTIYLFLTSSILGLVYLGFSSTTEATMALDLRQTVGKTLFGTTMFLQLLTACFVAPALTAGSISSEREAQTFDILRITLLSSRSLVLGKLGSTFLFILLLLFSTAPLLSLSFIFGGVTLAEVAIGSLILVVTTLTFSSVGIFFSSFSRRTLVSTILAYTFTLLLVFGIPAIISMLVAFLGISTSMSTNISRLTEIIFLGAGYLLVMINPIATAIVSEIILLEGQSAFYYNLPLPISGNVFIPSPWIGYILIYISVSILLIYLSERIVRQVER